MLIDQVTSYLLVVVFVRADAWNTEFRDCGGSATHGGEARVLTTRVDFDGDDFSGFGRSSDDLSFCRGGYSM
jgi:hypothetical protein